MQLKLLGSLALCLKSKASGVGCEFLAGVPDFHWPKAKQSVVLHTVLEIQVLGSIKYMFSGDGVPRLQML